MHVNDISPGVLPDRILVEMIEYTSMKCSLIILVIWAADSHTGKDDQNIKAGRKWWVTLQESDVQVDIMKNAIVNLLKRMILQVIHATHWAIHSSIQTLPHSGTRPFTRLM